MTEIFIYHLWKNHLYNHKNLLTAEGLPLKVIHPGTRNTDSGPDFFNSKIKLGETEWAGTVEIHQKTSDWFRHKHDKDPAYKNVILHVVWENDQSFHLPVLELKSYVSEEILQTYEKLSTNKTSLPCAGQVKDISREIISAWLSRTLIERLEEKVNGIAKISSINGSLDSVFYFLLAKSFGFGTNGQPFEMLANSLPLTILKKHFDSRVQIEALMFGQSGCLIKGYDEYQQTLKREYDHLKIKYRLEPLTPGVWKFMRLRPRNFPTVRIAQFAAILPNLDKLISAIESFSDIKELKELIQQPVSEYWETHYRFGETSKIKEKKIGNASMDSILINAVVPFVFYISRKSSREEAINYCFRILESLPSEANVITKMFYQAGIKTNNAFDSQALIQLEKSYCSKKQCLSCGIGNAVLNKSRK